MIGRAAFGTGARSLPQTQEGLDPEGIGAMVVGHDRRADPLGSAQGSELCEGLIELAGAGAAGQEEVELLSP
jgi:hypothetical protein